MKYKELTTKSENEVKQLLKDLQIEAHNLAVKIRLNQVKNTAKLRGIKKDVARVMTFLSKD